MIGGLILAGGEGRRMGGQDKALLRLGGISLVEHLAARLAPQLDHLAVSANGDPSRFASTGLPVLADAGSASGPLCGISRGLRWAAMQGCTALLSVPCDTPFIPADLVRRLLPAPSVAASRGRIHHAVALWPVGCGAALLRYLRTSPDRRVRAFAETIGMRAVAFDAGDDPFFNINTNADLEEAARLLSRAAALPPALPPG